MEQKTWLLFVYKVPSEPARVRVALWRKLKAMGGVYLQNGVCLLPRTDEHLRRLRVSDGEIREAGGETLLLETLPLDGGQEARIIERFNADRDQQYEELLEKCADFEGEIARETAAEKFTYAELEEIENDLDKLKGWAGRIRRLDFFEAPRSFQTAEALARCEALLEEFARRVFEAQDENR